MPMVALIDIVPEARNIFFSKRSFFHRLVDKFKESYIMAISVYYRYSKAHI